MNYGSKKQKYLIGIDEVGRGPLAGPVAVAAVLCFPRFDFKNLAHIKDSKQLNPQKREEWFMRARTFKSAGLIDFAVSFCGEKIIDKRGIMRAIKISLSRALKKICKNKNRGQAYIYLDGGLVAPAEYPFQKTIIRGDEKISIIALASIVAKVTRDKKMKRYGERFPLYGFEQHKGYGTAAHYKAIEKYGVCALHRRSFLPHGGTEDL